MRTYREEKEKSSGGEISKIKYDIIGLSDTKYQGEHLAKLKGGHTPCICGNFNNHKNDVELLRSRKTEKHIISTQDMNDRIALLILKINQRCEMKVIQVFASAASYQDQEVIEIYRETENLMKEEKNIGNHSNWDFNAKLGKKGDKKAIVMGNFEIGNK